MPLSKIKTNSVANTAAPILGAGTVVGAANSVIYSSFTVGNGAANTQNSNGSISILSNDGNFMLGPPRGIIDYVPSFRAARMSVGGGLNGEGQVVLTNFDGTAHWTGVTVRGKGYVQTENQPHARITYNESNTLTVQENPGSHWNSSTGRFTCPVNGRYLLCVHLSSSSTNNGGSTPRTWVGLYKNGGPISGIGGEVLDKWGVPITGGSGAYDMGTAMVITCAASDYFTTNIANGGDIVQYTFTYLG